MQSFLYYLCILAINTNCTVPICGWFWRVNGMALFRMWPATLTFPPVIKARFISWFCVNCLINTAATINLQLQPQLYLHLTTIGLWKWRQRNSSSTTFKPYFISSLVAVTCSALQCSWWSTCSSSVRRVPWRRMVWQQRSCLECTVSLVGGEIASLSRRTFNGTDKLVVAGCSSCSSRCTAGEAIRKQRVAFVSSREQLCMCSGGYVCDIGRQQQWWQERHLGLDPTHLHQLIEALYLREIALREISRRPRQCIDPRLCILEADYH